MAGAGGAAGEAAVGRISIRRSSLLLYVTGAFAAGTFLSQFLSRSVRRVQRYIESRGSNGGRCVALPIVLLCLWVSGCVGGFDSIDAVRRAEPIPVWTTHRRPILLLFGDSITQGGFDPQTGTPSALPLLINSPSTPYSTLAPLHT